MQPVLRQLVTHGGVALCQREDWLPIGSLRVRYYTSELWHQPHYILACHAGLFLAVCGAEHSLVQSVPKQVELAYAAYVIKIFGR
jgi:hypothetical protein